MSIACLDDESALLLSEGRTSGEKWAAVRAHLAGCPQCTALIAEVLRGESTDGVAGTFEEVGIRGHRRGEIVGTRWRLVHWLGAGCTGSVWKAEDVRGEVERCAVKLIAVESSDRARFRREATLLADLDHPNIVRAFDAFETERASGIVLELLEGESLSARLARKPLPSFEAGVGILRAVARALAFAHMRGVVHRDLKPSNVFLSREAPRVRLLDLGLAAPTDGWNGDTISNVTVTGSAVGTPLYMAPEQLFREPSAARSPQVDLWALGLMAHELLVGTLPFEPGPFGKLLRAVRRAPFDPLSHRAEIPHVLDDAVRTWLSFEATRRADAAAARATLEQVARAHGATDEW